MPFVDSVGPIGANTAYVGGTLVAKDVEATLPEVTPTMTCLLYTSPSPRDTT